MRPCYNEDFYPENFILLGSPDRQKKRAEEIVSEASIRFPEKFAGKEACFSFELRYIPPFDKGFHELKRLQGTAAEAAGRRDEFRGYIMIDMSDYVTHEKELYLEVTLRFLIDMSDSWKYIFLVDNSNAKAAKELAGKMLTVLLCDIPCEVKEDEPEPSAENIVDSICRKQKVICTFSVKNFFQDLLGQEGVSADVVTALIRDISGHCGQQISMNTLTDFLAKREPVVKYMLSQKQFEQFMSICEHRKENWHGEKEAV